LFLFKFKTTMVQNFTSASFFYIIRLKIIHYYKIFIKGENKMSEIIEEVKTNVGSNGTIGNKGTSGGSAGESAGNNSGSDNGSGGKIDGRKNTSRRVGKETRPVTVNTMETGITSGQDGNKIESGNGTSCGSSTSGGGSNGNRNGGNSEGSNNDKTNVETVSKRLNSEGSNNDKTNVETVSKRLSSIKPKDIKPSKAAGKSKETSKKDSGDITDADTLATIIQSGFALIAGMTNRRHWNVTSQEALTIATPASSMIQKLTAAQKKKINQITAPLILGAAIASVVVPRVLEDMQYAKGGVKVGQAKTNTIQSGSNNQINQDSGYQTNSVHIPGNGVGSNAEITGLFSTMDNPTTAGTIGT
jgi:hypothetical protein